ncbi:MAG TPA: alpha/beta hydrolase [Bryobacteraceae bacterium]|nr:alpha/beta hydrolase [Bryobacteraceae bacterium]
MTSSENLTVVVVHGAWADGSSWSEVIGPLVNKGLKVIAAPLPLTSLTDDAAALRRSLARTEGPIILAGHAYAGAVIATTREVRVRALVYIAGLAPAESETVAEVFYRDEPHALAPKLAPDEDGWIWMPEDGFAKAFAHHASPEQIAVAKAAQRPISIQSIQEKAPEPAWTSKPSWFLIAEEDRMINPKTQYFMAERMRAQIQALPVDHTPLLTASDSVVAMILAAAQSAMT